MKYIGHVFMIAFVFVNLILLLNMVIAMMADTYAMMSEIKRGIYNYEILRTYSMFKMNKYFGGMIAVTPPMNIICAMFAPLFMCWKNDKPKLKSLTDKIMMTNYLLHLMICTLVFMACNLVCLPFAYLKTLGSKIGLAKNGSINICEVLFYLVFGIPLLLAL